MLQNKCREDAANAGGGKEEDLYGKALYSVVDLHALTSTPARQTREELSGCSLRTAATLLAIGIDPNRSILFRQSRVAHHCELFWVLACRTPTGWLKRMTQFKEKSSNKDHSASLGLFSYPVLQAADILLYRATHVPVGQDQLQHIELARDIAKSFNHAVYGHNSDSSNRGANTKVSEQRPGLSSSSK